MLAGMTIHHYTVLSESASEDGALDGWQAVCDCGDVQSSSLSESEAVRLAERHQSWHLTRAANATSRARRRVVSSAS